MPDFYIFHQWVKIPPRQHGIYTTKCQQCGRVTIRHTNAREVCNGCTGRPVLCSRACFETLHSSDGYELFPFLRGGQGRLPQALLSRELGSISRGGLRKILTIEYVTTF